ncbi:MAG: sigma-70 family RNA polymerase sigma factor [Planctomycetota bacterium]
MTSQEPTCWSLVEGAREGRADARARFADAYLPVVRAYLLARWGRGPLREGVDDAVQDTFVECFRDAGALSRVSGGGRSRFRTFLYAVVRNVARRREERWQRDDLRRSPLEGDGEHPEARDARLSVAFDRAWANAILQRAVQRMRADARNGTDEARRQVELLRLRFTEDLPIRAIAERWDEDPASVHRLYARAREGYKRSLIVEMRFDQPELTAAELESACVGLLGLVGD